VPAAIHVTPECVAGGALARVRDGDPIRLDSVAGTLEALVPEEALQPPRARAPRPLGALARLRARAVRVVPQCGARRGIRRVVLLAMNVRDVLRLSPVIPVITVARIEHAVPLAQALVRGDQGLEITLRTDCALAALAAIATPCPTPSSARARSREPRFLAAAAQARSSR